MAWNPFSKKPKKEAPPFWSVENFKSLGILALVVLALRWSVASPYHVPTGSMEPTIKVGDRLLAIKFAYGIKVPFTDWDIVSFGLPKRGDIIVFKFPNDPSIDYVKRVVGLPGDEIRFENDILYVNGVAQERVDASADRKILDDLDEEPHTKLLYKETLDQRTHYTLQNIPSARLTSKADWPSLGQPPYRVPKDGLFCVGDNRDNSTDSRYWQHVPLENVRGKALFVLWSVFSPRDNSFPSLRWSRFGHWLYND